MYLLTCVCVLSNSPNRTSDEVMELFPVYIWESHVLWYMWKTQQATTRNNNKNKKHQGHVREVMLLGVLRTFLVQVHTMYMLRSTRGFNKGKKQLVCI